jgi:phage-related protein
MYGLGSNPAAKTTWPELVGLTAEEAERKIKEEKPGAQIQVVQLDCFVTKGGARNFFCPGLLNKYINIF